MVQQIKGYRLSPQQRRLWLLQQDNRAYFAQCTIGVEGNLNRNALEKALQGVVNRHEILRTSFRRIMGRRMPVQFIAENVSLPLKIVDLADRQADWQQQEIEALLQHEIEAIDLEQSPPSRSLLIKLSERKHLLFICLPAMSADACTLNHLIGEISRFYAGIDGSDDPEDSIQYVQFSEWQNELFEDEDAEAGREYWRNKNAGIDQRLALPFEDKRPQDREFVPACVEIATNLQASALLEKISLLTQQYEITEDELLLAIWQSLLWRVTGAMEIVVGAEFDGRKYEEVGNALGLFNKSLPIHCRFVEGMRFTTLLRQIAGEVEEADKWFDYYLIGDDDKSSAAEKFSAGFEYYRRMPPQKVGGITFSIDRQDARIERYKVKLKGIRAQEDLKLEIHFDKGLIAPEAISILADQFDMLLSAILEEPEREIAGLNMVSPEQRFELLVRMNDTKAEYPDGACVQELFSQQAKQTPEAVAIEYGDQHMSYRMLNEQANQLASYLCKMGVKPEALVGICLERSIDLVVGLFAIWKAGGAYLPLSASYPKERLSFMLANSRAAVVITKSDMLETPGDQPAARVCLDKDLEAIGQEPAEDFVSGVRAENLAYVIYTSGSTGRPKGVMISHQAVINYLSWSRKAYRTDGGTGSVMHSPIGFDLTVTSLYLPLIEGKKVVLVREEEGIAGLGTALLKGHDFSLVKLTPAHLDILKERFASEKAEGLTQAFVIGGEALIAESLSYWRQHAPAIRLINEYGPTETTVGCCIYEVEEEIAGPVPIGRPISNTRIYVLNGELEPAAVGQQGEIYISGAGVARGYLDSSELTAEKFIPDRFSSEPDRRMYKTGDIGRHGWNGELEFCGRVDDQVKIRGYRIEPGEIESLISECAGVKECVVVVREEGGEKRLVGYVVMEGKGGVEEIKRQLKQRVPDYMMPGAVVMMEKLPLNANGKVDKRALPAPGKLRPELAQGYIAPRNHTEEILAAIWADVLGIDEVGIHDSFFALGGDSIRVVRVVALSKERGLTYSVEQLFRHQTISELARELQIEKAQSSAFRKTEPFSLISGGTRAKLPADVEDAYPLCMLQAGMLYHLESTPESPAYHNINSYNLRARFVLEKFREAVQYVVARHAVLRTSFDLTSYSEPLQLVHQTCAFPIYVEDLRHLPTAEQDKAIAAFVEAERVKLFDLSKPPLIRFMIHRRTDHSFQFTLTECHAIADGWSTSSTFAEAFTHYFALLQGEPLPEEPPLAVTYRDFVLLERMALESEECQNYWRQKLAAFTPVKVPVWPLTSIPEGQKMRRLDFAVAAQIFEGLKHIGRSVAVPFKSVALAVHLKVVSMITGETDIATGIVSNGRPETLDGERVRGLFLNTLPLRFKVSEGTWADLIREAFNAEREFLPYRRYPMAALQKHGGGQALFDVAFNYLQFHSVEKVARSGHLEFLPYGNIESSETNFPFGISFFSSPISTQLALIIEYDTTLFSEEQVSAFHSYYQKVMQAMVADPLARHEAQCLLTDEELSRLLVDWNNTRTDSATDQCAHDLFQAQVERTPEAIAVIYEGQQLTYRKLNQSANQLARYLREIGLGADIPAAIYMDRSIDIDAMVAILAILKAGGTYVPLITDYPAERIAFILEDCHARVVLVQNQLPDEIILDGVQVINVNARRDHIARYGNANLVTDAQADNLAYVIYTSGSTGQPKGVMITHKGLCNLARAQIKAFGIEPDSRILQFASLSFDASVSEIFTALLTGATLCLTKQDSILPGPSLAETLRNQVISLVTLPPSIMSISPSVEFPALRTVVSAGEACSADVAERWSAGHRFLNAYGPTEVTVCASVAEYQQGKAPYNIGSPIDNTQLYVLDKYLGPAPIGVKGELYVGGTGLARGYVNQPDLTAHQFMPNAFAGDAGERLYKTGDLARYLPDGTIEFFGRNDYQLKVRGFRIEPAEIETLLNQHPRIKESVVIAREDIPDDKRIVAYIVEDSEASHLSGNIDDAKDESAAKPMELWPSVSEFYVYDEFLYYVMANDEKRNYSYNVAFHRLVKDKVVVEIGTGAHAILAKLCVEAGAKRVYAIELLQESYEQALAHVEKLGLQGKIILIQGDSMSIELPEKADVCVSEIVGPIGGSEGAAYILNDARRFLKPGGVMIPQRSVTKIAAVCLDDELINHLDFPKAQAGLVEKVFAEVGYPFDLRVCLGNFSKSNLMSSADVFEDLDFRDFNDLSCDKDVTLEIARDGRIDGFLAWLNLHTIEGEVIDILEHRYCWLPVYLPVFYPGVDVSRGDVIKASCRHWPSDNGLHPDYQIQGSLTRSGGETIDFDYVSYHHKQAFKQTPFYERLFADYSMPGKEHKPDSVSVEELRAYLEKRLPAYMIPSLFVKMESLPLTTSGKIDRKALPPPGGSRPELKRSYVAPRTGVEKMLAEIWSSVLGIDSVGVYDNFFDLGGDSILSVQIVARANRAGLKLIPRQLFQYTTIASLATVIGIAEKVQAEQHLVTGAVPLTPIQRWFLEKELPDPHHFNQAVLLEVKEPIDVMILEGAVKRLLDHHDGLRLRFTKAGEGWQQMNAEAEAAEVVTQVDLSDLSDAEQPLAIEAVTGNIQTSLNLEQGPLMRVAIINPGKGKASLLLIVIHHLAVDGVSWRILLEDLERVFRQLSRGEEVDLPPKTTSFKQWAERLNDYARQESTGAELTYWMTQSPPNLSRLPLDCREGMNAVGSADTVIMTMNREDTRLLLQQIPRAYHTQINDVLLTALSKTLNRWTRGQALLIDIEGHGREPLFDDLDLSRTVGWFTTFFPIVLNHNETDSVGDALKQMKEKLRAIPNHGIGYGLLRYLSNDRQAAEKLKSLPPAEVSFQYLGQFDQTLSEFSPFGPADQSPGPNRSPKHPRGYLLEIEASVAGGCLQTIWAYSKDTHWRTTIETLAREFLDELQSIINHCLSLEEEVYTPSDFPEANLSQGDLDSILEQFRDLGD